MTEQATQRDFEGRVIYRWQLVLPDGTRVYTWAASRADAVAKCVEYRHVEPLGVYPAQSMV